MVNGEDLLFETNKNIYNFQQIETRRSFAKNISGAKITLNNADKDQNSLLVEFMNFKKKRKPKNPVKKQQKRDSIESYHVLLEDREKGSL